MNIVMFCIMSQGLVKEEQGAIWTFWRTEIFSEKLELGGIQTAERHAFRNQQKAGEGYGPWLATMGLRHEGIGRA